jgi:hypothetical protein
MEFMQINLSTLAIIMGLGLAVPQLYGLAQPGAFAVRVRKFPRSLPCGVALMLVGTLWFLCYLNNEPVADFASYKPALLAGFAAVGVGSCLFVRDFLAVRGLAVVLLLLAKLMVDTARWADTEWRLVIITWAYLLVCAGIWFTVWPWHLRDLLNWANANEQRVRVGSALRLAFGLFVAALGFTVFRG